MWPVSMRVTVDASLRAGVEKVAAETGRADVLVNNAGHGSYGGVEDVPIWAGWPGWRPTRGAAAPVREPPRRGWVSGGWGGSLVFGPGGGEGW